MIAVRFALVVSLAILLGACASAGRETRRGQDRTVLTAENLKPHTNRTLYEVIRLERPQWLSTRGPTSLANAQPGDEVIVYRDGVKVGGLEHLRDITANLVASVRFLTGPEAQSRFGMDHQSGAILITTVKD